MVVWTALTPDLSPEERVKQLDAEDQLEIILPVSVGLFFGGCDKRIIHQHAGSNNRRTNPPLLGGEGWGEGER
jgi:hypothetical protein